MAAIRELMQTGLPVVAGLLAGAVVGTYIVTYDWNGLAGRLRYRLYLRRLGSLKHQARRLAGKKI